MNYPLACDISLYVPRSLVLMIEAETNAEFNPSTADESGPDPTVRRCMGYAARWGYGRFVMLNLFAFRATDPRVMLAEPNPVGAENDSFLFGYGLDANLVVAAWGNHGLYRNRGVEVALLVPGLHALKITKMGQPSHPLYLKGNLTPERFDLK